LESIPSSVYCTDCGDAITTEALLIAANISSEAAATASQAAVSKCGANFGDGQLPSDIETAGSTGIASSSNSSGGSGAAGPSLVLSSKAFALVATFTAVVAGVSIAFS